jgi:aminomethyltransferase
MQTPLFNVHMSSGAKIVEFAGWQMPLLYRSIISEHNHTRNKVSIFDTCHMGEFEIEGESAQEDIEKLVTQNISLLRDGMCAYGYLLNENGGTMDDLICFRFSKEKFWLVVNAGTRVQDAEWIKTHISPCTIFRDISNVTAKIDIQGPCTKEEVEATFNFKLPDMRYFSFTQIKLSGTDCVLSRTGYTGEFGYELFVPSEKVEHFWNTLLNNKDILPAGLGARDSLRLEAGLPLYGHELSIERTPAGAMRQRFVDFSKDFYGKDALIKDMQKPGLPVMCGVKFEGRMAARHGDKIIKDDEMIGTVTSGLFSPSLQRAVAIVFIRKDRLVYGDSVCVDLRGKILSGVVEKLPLYKAGSARK